MNKKSKVGVGYLLNTTNDLINFFFSFENRRADINNAMTVPINKYLNRSGKNKTNQDAKNDMVSSPIKNKKIKDPIPLDIQEVSFSFFEK